MLRLSKLADYAVVVLVRLSHTDGCQTSPGVAAVTGLPEPTVAKVLKALAGAQLVVSQRGARGGYRLGRTLDQVSVLDVVEAIDGPMAVAACVEGGAGGCAAEELCPVRGRWDPVNRAMVEALGRISLADMISVPGRPRVAASGSVPVHSNPVGCS